MSYTFDSSWKDEVTDYLSYRTETTVRAVISECLRIVIPTKSHSNFVAGLLRDLGYDRYQRRVSGTDQREWAFRKNRKPSDRPRSGIGTGPEHLNVSVDRETSARIQRFWHQEQFSNRAEAVRSLIERGLSNYETAIVTGAK